GLLGSSFSAAVTHGAIKRKDYRRFVVKQTCILTDSSHQALPEVHIIRPSRLILSTLEQCDRIFKITDDDRIGSVFPEHFIRKDNHTCTQKTLSGCLFDIRLEQVIPLVIFQFINRRVCRLGYNRYIMLIVWKQIDIDGI